MSHPAILIERARSLLEANYPSEEGFLYTYERAIPGTRMMPDIAVRLGAALVCVVEIGYTRPEKLTAYRALRIPDVRWYDKQLNLHADVQERVINVRVSIEPPRDLYVYHAYGWHDCYCDTPNEVIARYMRRFGLTDRLEEMLNDLSSDTYVIIGTDYARLWAAGFCDRCRTWEHVDEFSRIWCDLHGSPRDMAELFGARIKMGWSNFSEETMGFINLEDYETRLGVKRSFRDTIAAMRLW